VLTLPVVRTAHLEELDAVIDILAECSAWLRSKGIVQWPDRYSPAQLLPSLEAGDLYVVEDGDALAATVTLQWSDPMFWGDRADAGVLHRLGVRRSHAGLGRDVVAWAETEASARGRAFLCLDCLSTNHRLRRYYEERGFSMVGQVMGPPGHAQTVAHGPWTAVLYEKPLRPCTAPG
jgi:protein-tyrosine phosphatase